MLVAGMIMGMMFGGGGDEDVGSDDGGNYDFSAKLWLEIIWISHRPCCCGHLRSNIINWK